MKFRAVLSIVATTAGVWALSGPACTPTDIDREAEVGQASAIESSFTPPDSVQVGQQMNVTVTITAQGTPRPNIKVTWRTSNGAVSSDTTVTDANGTTSVVWTAGTQPVSSADLTVRVPENDKLSKTWQSQVYIPGLIATGVELKPDTLRLNIGQTSQANARMITANGTTVPGAFFNYLSLDSTIATIGFNSGAVQGVRTGTTRVYAMSTFWRDTIVVVVGQTVTTSVTVSPKTWTMDVGDQVQLSAIVFGTSETAQWNSLNPTLAAVSNTGRVTASGAGVARIVASAGGKADTAVVTINAVVTGVTISPKTVTMNQGGQQQFTATVQGLPNATVTWSAFPATTIQVDQSGRATALGTGSAKVVATAGNKADTATVTINAASSNTVTITATAPTTIKKNGDNTTESFSGSPLFVGDHEATGDKGMQGFVLFNLSNIPTAATVTSATISVSGADSNAGNPFALGPLMVENAGVPSLAEGTPSSGAVTIMSSFQNNVTVNVTDIINTARASGATTVWLRFRMQQFVNNNGAMNYGEFTVSDMTVKY